MDTAQGNENIMEGEVASDGTYDNEPLTSEIYCMPVVKAEPDDQYEEDPLFHLESNNNADGSSVEIELTSIQSSDEDRLACSWSRKQTIRLIDAYRQLIPRLGKPPFRWKKQIWEYLAIIVGNVTASQCQNRWKVLTRNYKNIVECNKKRKRSRWKINDYAEYLHPILSKNKIVNPEIVLYADTITNPPDGASSSQSLTTRQPSSPTGSLLEENDVSGSPNEPMQEETTTPQTAISGSPSNLTDEVDDGSEDADYQPQTRKSNRRIQPPKKLRLDEEKNLADPMQIVFIQHDADNFLLQWSKSRTMKLIEAYRQLIPRLGKPPFRWKKQMWEYLAKMVGKVTASQCENKWKVLVRNYRSIVDHNKKAGQGKLKFCEFAEYLEPILTNQKNFSQETFDSVSADAISTSHGDEASSSQLTTQQPSSPAGCLLEENDVSGSPNEPMQEETATPQIAASRSPSPPMIDETNDRSDNDDDDDDQLQPKKMNNSRASVLRKIRLDKKKYQEGMLSIHKERLEVEKKRLEVLTRKSELHKESNKILERLAKLIEKKF